MKNWTPTPENVNALPDKVRSYVHDLETNADPAGMVAENTIAKDIINQLRKENERLRKSAFTLFIENYAGHIDYAEDDFERRLKALEAK